MENKHEETGGDGFMKFAFVAFLIYVFYKIFKPQERTNEHDPTYHEATKQDESADNKTNLEKGLKAFEDGDHEKAFNLLLPEAKDGKPQAELVIGKIYLNKKDNVNAHMWLSIAYKHGQTEAKNILESLEKEMSKKEIEEAQIKAAKFL